MLVENLERDGSLVTLVGYTRTAVTEAGLVALCYLGRSDPAEEGPNPPMFADREATVTLVKCLDPYLRAFAEQYGCTYTYFGEEFAGAQRDRILDQLGAKGLPVSTSYDQFFKSLSENHIGVLMDGLDGSMAHWGELPLFSVSIALFIGQRPRVGAISLPCQGEVYSAALGEGSRVAHFLDLHTGRQADLLDEHALRLARRKTQRPQIGYQITRSSPEKRNVALRLLHDLPQEFTVYMINSGQFVLAQVAKGSLDLYVNHYTNGWDIAAGQVLVEAVGGKVTDTDGQPIKYREERIGIIAAVSPELHDQVVELQSRHA